LDSKEKLETFDRSKAAEDQQKEEALEVAWRVKKVFLPFPPRLYGWGFFRELSSLLGDIAGVWRS